MGRYFRSPRRANEGRRHELCGRAQRGFRWTVSSQTRKDVLGPLFEWYANGDGEPANGMATVSQASADDIQPTLDDLGVLVVGRHVFDVANGREANPPGGG
jgi:hypothetical protein